MGLSPLGLQSCFFFWFSSNSITNTTSRTSSTSSTRGTIAMVPNLTFLWPSPIICCERKTSKILLAGDSFFLFTATGEFRGEYCPARYSAWCSSGNLCTEECSKVQGSTVQLCIAQCCTIHYGYVQYYNIPLHKV